MFIISQSGDWAVNTDQVVAIRQMPHNDGSKSTAIRVEVSSKNEFVLAAYTDKDFASKVFSELLSVCVIGNRAFHQLPEDTP